MSTALSWTELRASQRDLASLLAFRRSGLTAKSGRRLRFFGVLVLALTLTSVLGPAYLGGDFPREHSGTILALLPSACLGFLALAAFTAVASAGGREVIPRDQAVAFPVSTTTDHLGALLMAPLNIAWIMQTWVLLGMTSYVLGPDRVWAYEIPVLLWIVAATALAQVVGWMAEGVRRGRHGIAIVRSVDGPPRRRRGRPDRDRNRSRPSSTTARPSGSWSSVLDAQNGQWGSWALGVAGPARDVPEPRSSSVRCPRDGPCTARCARSCASSRVATPPGRRPARTSLMLLRIDRAAVWRSVPLRRGMTVLALMPGAVALAGQLEWRMLTVLPGLVASGGALLFGVNTWCLDGRGALWRDSLPVSPRLSFYSRVVVLMEVLLCSATAHPAAGRACAPDARPWPRWWPCSARRWWSRSRWSPPSMRWSIARPFAVDLRSARATPAPPVVMAGYSARLAVATTFTGLIFSGLAQLGDVRLALGRHPRVALLVGVAAARRPPAAGRIRRSAPESWRSSPDERPVR